MAATAPPNHGDEDVSPPWMAVSATDMAATAMSKDESVRLLADVAGGLN